MEDNKEADNSPQTETTITKSSPGIGRLILRVFLLVVIPIIAIVFGAQWYEKTGRYVETENAYVKTNVIAISADIDGRVTEVFVDENQLISKGDLLFKLDPNTYAVAIQMGLKSRLDLALAHLDFLLLFHAVNCLQRCLCQSSNHGINCLVSKW